MTLLRNFNRNRDQLRLNPEAFHLNQIRIDQNDVDWMQYIDEDFRDTLIAEDSVLVQNTSATMSYIAGNREDQDSSLMKNYLYTSVHHLLVRTFTKLGYSISSGMNMTLTNRGILQGINTWIVLSVNK